MSSSSVVVYKRPTQDKENNMFRRTVQFVKLHPILTAGAVGAAVGYKFGYDNAIKNVLEEAAELSYRWGNENGVLAVQNGVMLDFINQQGLSDEMRQFLTNLGDKSVEQMLQ